VKSVKKVRENGKEMKESPLRDKSMDFAVRIVEASRIRRMLSATCKTTEERQAHP
jgi:hypothetical protein